MLPLITLIFATIFGVKGQCTLKEQPKVTVNRLCSADISCVGTTGNLIKLVKNDWSCIKHARYDDIYYVTIYTLATDYNLNVYISNVDINISEDYLTGITDDVATKVQTLIIENGNLVSIGIKLTRFRRLTEFSLTYNNVETINLKQLAGGSVKTVNVSHNCISTIEFEAIESTVPSSITTIDLSYNELESIPNNCFAMFSHLRYLDLSSNKLKEFDILTFEGIAQLEVLQLSYNKISEIGQNFARFMKLKDLSLDNNQIMSLTDLNFRNLNNLQKLNLSTNLINHIEDQTLAALTNLEQLDLSHNKINRITQLLFKNNIKMYKLSLSHNEIQNIERGAFRTANISYFDIENNYISGSIEYDTFLGVSVESLDLSNGNLTKLGHKTFCALSPTLRYLNLSTNLIENITVSAFQSLKILSKLDLSYNNLTSINYNTSDLTELTEYYLHNNKIKMVTPKMFTNMTSLMKLDLSHNEIIEVKLNSFIELKNLKVLNINRNSFVKSLKGNLFRGLCRVETLDLSYTRSMLCLNGSFSGMVSLMYLNFSHSQLETIEYEMFEDTGSIKIIDLSFNMLENFHINTTSISQLSELYINHNKLKNITSETFYNLRHLEKLSLACNNIFHIESIGLRTLSHLYYLDLYSNYNLHLLGDVFDNLELSQVSLRNVEQHFSFKNAMNVSIRTLVLSNCKIEDINSVVVYKIRNILKLVISANKIKMLDKSSFQDMAALNWLDLSFNMISNIQPGTFSSNKMINTLDLYSNNLQSLRYGVFDGLKNLRVLNLSNNEIHIFGVNLLHNTPYLTDLFLENNNLESMDFKAFSETSIQLLTIGGNRISCDVLADWRKNNNNSFKYVSAGTFDFYSENIYGISCKGQRSFSQKTTLNENTNMNVTSEVIEIKEIVGQLYNYLKTTLNVTFSNFIPALKNVSDNVNPDKISENLNRSQMVFNEQLRHLITENKKLSDSVVNDINLMILLLERNNNIAELGCKFQNQIGYSKEPSSDKTTEVHENQNLTNVFRNSKIVFADSLEVKVDQNLLAHLKVVLYFIAFCLANIVLCCVIVITYIFLYKHKYIRTRAKHTYDSGLKVGNALEME